MDPEELEKNRSFLCKKEKH